MIWNRFGGVKIEQLSFHNSEEMINVISADIEKLIISGGFPYGQIKKQMQSTP